MAKVLIVEDDKELSEKLQSWLSFEKHQVDAADSGDDALEKLRFYQYDVVILDWMLPGRPGVEVLREFRDSGGRTPVIMLTGRKDVTDKAEGLDSGADDYLTKPFDARELSARIRALLRRPAVVTATQFTEGDLLLDPTSQRVTKAGVEVQLRPLEYALLEFLIRHKDQLFSAEALLNRVWGSDSDASVDTLRTYVKTLRKKIDTAGQESMIATVHGKGYRFVGAG